MAQEDHDRAFLNHLNSLINSGAREVSVPGGMIAQASDEALDEARRLCKLTGVKIRNVDFTERN